MSEFGTTTISDEEALKARGFMFRGTKNYADVASEMKVDSDRIIRWLDPNSCDRTPITRENLDLLRKSIGYEIYPSEPVLEEYRPIPYKLDWVADVARKVFGKLPEAGQVTPPEDITTSLYFPDHAPAGELQDFFETAFRRVVAQRNLAELQEITIAALRRVAV